MQNEGEEEIIDLEDQENAQKEILKELVCFSKRGRVVYSSIRERKKNNYSFF